LLKGELLHASVHVVSEYQVQWIMVWPHWTCCHGITCNAIKYTVVSSQFNLFLWE